MSNLEELQTVKPAGEAFAALIHNRHLQNPDVFCFVDRGQLPGHDESDSNFFVAVDADGFSNSHTLGAAQLEITEPGTGHLRLVASEDLAAEFGDVEVFTHSIMRKVGVERVYLDTESDTNVTPEILRKAGATAIAPHLVEFQFAA